MLSSSILDIPTTKPLLTVKVIMAIVCMVFTSSCAEKQVQPLPEPEIISAPVEPSLSPLPLEELTKVDYKFAQAALDQLGYDVVYIDGIWGPKSATAIKQFENDNQLISANGLLSELNLTRLSEATTVNRNDFEVTAQSTQPTQTTFDERGIATKLDPNIPLSQSPQLIITDLSYAVLAKPNPYSETVAQLPQGTGLYIIGLQEGWYEVETLERTRGYIQE